MTSGTSVARPRGATDVAVTSPVDLLGGASFGELLQAAGSLVKSGLLPEKIKTPEQAVVIILQGRELGLPTMLSLRKIHVIDGVPTLAAELQLALFKARGGRAEQRKSTDQECTFWFRHPAGDEHIETYTIQDAEREGLIAKHAWRRMPKKMLRWRAISGGLKIIAPEIVSGLYSPEELGVDVDDQGEAIVVSSEPLPPRPVRVRQAAEQGSPVAAQAFDEIPKALTTQSDEDRELDMRLSRAEEAQPTPPSDPPAPRYISEGKRRALWARARERDLQGDTETELRKIVAYVQDVALDQVDTTKITDEQFDRITEELSQYPMKQR